GDVPTREPEETPEPKPAEEPKEAPAPKAEEKPAPEKAKPEPPKAPRRRHSIPGAIKLIVALVLNAVAFIVLAVVAGGGEPKKGGSDETPAPVSSVPAPEPEAPEATPTTEAAEELGYPAFATNNTTRVGGSDPASTAAGVALAVFPGASESQRPAAVTLVGEEDWAGAIAAA